MPLLRGNIFGYDAARMTFEFMMLTSDAKTVACSISGAALDYLAGKKGADLKAREAQFQRFRVTIERLASDLFDDGTVPVRIFAKHVESRKPHKSATIILRDE